MQLYVASSHFFSWGSVVDIGSVVVWCYLILPRAVWYINILAPLPWEMLHLVMKIQGMIFFFLISFLGVRKVREWGCSITGKAFLITHTNCNKVDHLAHLNRNLKFIISWTCFEHHRHSQEEIISPIILGMSRTKELVYVWFIVEIVVIRVSMQI